MLLARNEARAEMGAAEQHFTAALAHERAELNKQARSLLCMRSSGLHRQSLVLRRVCAASWNGRTGHASCSIGRVVVELI